MDTTAADPLTGTLLDGRYHIGPRIARGGMGSVFEATDTRLDRLVAVKVLHRGYADDDDFVTRFVREARAAAQLTHPNVVGVFDQGEDHGTLFLAMEYVPGHTLRDLLHEQGPLPSTRALALLEPVLSALGAAHGAGFVHRDVKPENVLITDDGRVKVADFGLTRAVTSDTLASTTGVLMGSVSYLAPELVVDGYADARADVYAAGVLLYEMLTGQKPHQGETPLQVAYKHVHRDVPAPSQAVPGIPPYLDALVARATARDRTARAADAAVLLHHVRRVRHALEHGVFHDPELTQDLVPILCPTLSLPVNGVRGEDTLIVDPALGVGISTSALPERPQRPIAHASEKQRSRRRQRVMGWVAGVVVLMLAATAAVGGWYYGVGRFTTAPQLASLSVEQARGRLAGTDLTLDISDRAFSERVPAGEIITTDPASGQRIMRGGIIEVVVSRGRERIAVPDVAGDTEAQARDELVDIGLAVGDVQHRYDEVVPAGVVIGSEPAQARLRRDAEVDLMISRGPRPIPVPDLVGDAKGRARVSLEDLGLQLEVTDRAHDEDVSRGRVLSQDPAERTPLVAGDVVQVTVSMGPPLVDVPSVFGQARDDAVADLEAHGFTVDIQQADAYVGLNLVGSQDPSSSERAPQGSTVTIYLY